MAKKKRRKNKVFGLFGWIFDCITNLGRVSLRVLPAVLFILMATGIFVGAKQLLYADVHLRIKNITVEPAASLAIASRVTLEQKYLNKNLLTVDIKEIARGLEKNPEVLQAKVSRRLPNEVYIEVEKRQPAANVQFRPKGAFGLIAEDGVILDVDSQPDPAYVLIEAYGMGFHEPQSGMQIKTRGFSDAIRFMKAFWNDPLARRETITRMQLDHLGNLSITLGAGPLIRLGRDPIARLPELAKMVHLLEAESRYQIEYVDLQFDHVIVKRKGEAHARKGVR